MTTTLLQPTTEAIVAANAVALLTSQAKLIADRLALAKNDFLASGVSEVILADGTKVAAIDSPTREFDFDMLRSLLSVEAWEMVTKVSISAAQFDAASKLGKVPAEAETAITMVERTIVKVTNPRA